MLGSARVNISPISRKRKGGKKKKGREELVYGKESRKSTILPFYLETSLCCKTTSHSLKHTEHVHAGILSFMYSFWHFLINNHYVHLWNKRF
jgi:hypothetical protein